MERLGTKAVGYVRVTAQELQNGAPSCECQKDMITEYAAEHGLTLTNIYEDEPIQRTGYYSQTMGGVVELLDAVLHRANIRYVIVTAPDRLRRPETDLDSEWELMRRRRSILVVGRDVPDVEIPQVAEWIDEPPTNEAIDDTPVREKLLRGRMEAALSGRHQSGPAPYGYTRDDGSRIIVPDPIEASIVEIIFKKYIEVESLDILARYLKGHGISTRRGKKWSRQGLSWIIKNETYIGIVHFNKIRSKGIHKALIDKEVFDTANKILSRRSHGV